MKKQIIPIGVLILLVIGGGAVWLHQQALIDWLRLRGYVAPVGVAALADDDGMTPQARHLFYVNRPQVTRGSAFTAHCPAGGEKTVVLGCYIGRDAGIYVYQVTDTRLNGVEQVTAAHEMLHAAYRRLSTTERKKVDAMLQDYYQNDLHDQRLKETIAAYQKSEPNDVVNEMHSVFGTEAANLPAPLEAYYRQYFTNRARVTGYTASYQAEFTGRQTQVAQYDAQLKTMKSQITADEGTLAAQRSLLDATAKRMDQERGAGQVAAYNADVPTYNRLVDSYNAQLAATKDLITRYNAIVDARNQIALEEQQLAQALSANALSQQ